jgi:hypothetical protein
MDHESAKERKREKEANGESPRLLRLAVFFAISPFRAFAITGNGATDSQFFFAPPRLGGSMNNPDSCGLTPGELPGVCPNGDGSPVKLGSVC